MSPAEAFLQLCDERGGEVNLNYPILNHQLSAVEEMLDALPDKIVEIQTYEFGRDILHSERSYDFALVSGFANLETLQRYQTHPDHQKVLAHLQTICEDIRAVDFEEKYTPPDTLADLVPLSSAFRMP